MRHGKGKDALRVVGFDRANVERSAAVVALGGVKYRIEHLAKGTKSIEPREGTIVPADDGAWFVILPIR